MARRWIAVFAMALLLATAATACVSRADYDEAAKSADQARSELAKRTRDDAAELSRLQQRLPELEMGRTSVQKQLDDATVVDEQLSKELKRLGQDSQSLLAVNGTLKET
ncbi:MAG TPA: hypothetical protein VN894_21185, partial [Polyangiaceae bacterium]|nr:hypothetical protein [Polyangiaceae bacterium]